jgi:hypothetical protein
LPTGKVEGRLQENENLPALLNLRLRRRIEGILLRLREARSFTGCARVGLKDNAQDYLSCLRETMDKIQWEADAEALSFLREAEELQQPRSEKTNK